MCAYVQDGVVIYRHMSTFCNLLCYSRITVRVRSKFAVIYQNVKQSNFTCIQSDATITATYYITELHPC